MNPAECDHLLGLIHRIRQRGIALLLMEQNASLALALADRGYVIERGRIDLTDTGERLLANPDVQSSYLGGAGGGALISRPARKRAAPTPKRGAARGVLVSP